MHGRATVSLWAREEDGSYQAEKDGWKLHVSWTPEPRKGGPWGFRWAAEGPEGKKVEAPELLEEIEVAMMTAEYVAAHEGNLPPPPLSSGHFRPPDGRPHHPMDVPLRARNPNDLRHAVAKAYLASSLRVMGAQKTRIFVAAPLREYPARPNSTFQKCPLGDSPYEKNGNTWNSQSRPERSFFSR
jgi:hypothetical protein